jgi:hypothetical protein
MYGREQVELFLMGLEEGMERARGGQAGGGRRVDRVQLGARPAAAQLHRGAARTR